MKFIDYINENQLENIENVKKLSTDEIARDMTIMKLMVNLRFYEKQLRDTTSIMNLQQEILKLIENHKDEFKVPQTDVNDYIDVMKEQLKSAEDSLDYLAYKRGSTKGLLEGYENGTISNDIYMYLFDMITSREENLSAMNNPGTYINLLLQVKSMLHKEETENNTNN